MRRVIIILLAIPFFSCASYHTINDLSMLDFSSSTVSLNSNQVTPEGAYTITVSAFDPEKGKNRYINLSKNVQITEINNFIRVGYQVGSASIKVAGTSMLMLDAGSIVIKIENMLNGTSKEVSYPLRWLTAGRIILEPMSSGSGARTTIKVALLDTSRLPNPQGKLLYIKDTSTGLIYLHSLPVVVEARGKTGRSGSRGADSYSYNIWGGAMDGQDGKDGDTGYPGGKLIFEGSNEAISYIKGEVPGGAGGAGGAGGRGAPGQVKIIAFTDYRRYYDEIEKIIDASGNEYLLTQSYRSKNGLEEEFNRYGSSQSNTIKVRFKAGRSGRAGRTGLTGPSGTIVEIASNVDSEAFKTNIALSKYLKITDLN